MAPDALPRAGIGETDREAWGFFGTILSRIGTVVTF